MQSLTTLLDQEQAQSNQTLTPSLRQLYDGDLHFPGRAEPYIIANFVSTLDGVISFGLPGRAGGGAISGSNSTDRFTMGLLRSAADAILVGARTVHDVGPESLWTPEYSCPSSRPLYEELRSKLGKPRFPIIVIVSGSGQLDLSRAVFRAPGTQTIIVTTDAGREVLANAGSAKLSGLKIITQEAKNGLISAPSIVGLLHSSYGVRLLLHEGGARLFGQFLEAGLINELFLTVAPQIAGRATNPTRPALVEGLAFTPQNAPWFRLLTVKNSGDHLFLRYRNSGPRRPVEP